MGPLSIADWSARDPGNGQPEVAHSRSRRHVACGLGLIALLLAAGCQHERAMSVSVDTITSEAQFNEEVLQSSLPVVVDFGASWCGPCHLMQPIVADLAAEYTGRANVRYVDVDEVSSLAVTYEIQALPTFVFFRGGEEVGREIGTFSYEEMLALIERYLPEANETPHQAEAAARVTLETK